MNLTTFFQSVYSGAISQSSRDENQLRIRRHDANDVWNHKPEEFADPSFVAELDKSGFIKSLYGK